MVVGDVQTPCLDRLGQPRAPPWPSLRTSGSILPAPVAPTGTAKPVRHHCLAIHGHDQPFDAGSSARARFWSARSRLKPADQVGLGREGRPAASLLPDHLPSDQPASSRMTLIRSDFPSKPM